MYKAHSILALVVLLLGGCMSTENANLARPISDSSKAEIVGSKIKSTGPLPHRIWAAVIDGKTSPEYGYPWDQIFSLDPGKRKIAIQYEGAVMTMLGTTPKPFAAQEEFILEAAPNVRYITKGRFLDGRVTLWIEEYPSGRVVTPEQTKPVTWLEINVRIY